MFADKINKKTYKLLQEYTDLNIFSCKTYFLIMTVEKPGKDIKIFCIAMDKNIFA